MFLAVIARWTIGTIIIGTVTYEIEALKSNCVNFELASSLCWFIYRIMLFKLKLRFFDKSVCLVFSLALYNQRCEPRIELIVVILH